MASLTERERKIMTMTESEPELTQALQNLRHTLAEHKGKLPNPLPRHLERRSIDRIVSVFQPRELEGRFGEDEAHLKTVNRH